MWVSYAIRVFYHQHHNFFRGGSVGAYLGMLVFRHKTLKPLFRFGVPVIMLVHTLVAVYVWK